MAFASPLWNGQDVTAASIISDAMVFSKHLMGGSGGVLITYCISTVLPEFNTLSEEPVIYPNPFTNEFIISDINSITDLRIYDLAGREVFSQQIEPGNQKIDTQYLQSGLYFLEIVVDGHYRIKKIVKE